MENIENISLSLTDDLTKTDIAEYNKLVEAGLTSSTLLTQSSESNIDVEVKAETVPHKPKANRASCLLKVIK